MVFEEGESAKSSIFNKENVPSIETLRNIVPYGGTIAIKFDPRHPEVTCPAIALGIIALPLYTKTPEGVEFYVVCPAPFDHLHKWTIRWEKLGNKWILLKERNSKDKTNPKTSFRLEEVVFSPREESLSEVKGFQHFAF